MTLLRLSAYRAMSHASVPLVAVLLAACGAHDDGAAVREVPGARTAISAPVVVVPSAPVASAPSASVAASPSSSAAMAAAPGEDSVAAQGPVLEAPAYTGPITQGVNTDQSLPEHPVLGPTAPLPQGTRQVGH